MTSPSALRELARLIERQDLAIVSVDELEDFADATTDLMPARDTYAAGLIVDALRQAADAAELSAMLS
jgi:hypothetical protein